MSKNMFQLTIAVEDAQMVQLLATMCEVAVKGHEASCFPPHVIAATDWYLNQLRFQISNEIDQFDDDEVALLAGYLRRCADLIEGFVTEAVEDEEPRPGGTR
jgi:hypothetical protein